MLPVLLKFVAEIVPPTFGYLTKNGWLAVVNARTQDEHKTPSEEKKLE